MGMFLTIDPYFWLHDTPHRRVYVPSTKTLTAYYHLMMNMVYVYLAHSGAEFWYISFCSLFDYYYSLWSKIFDLYGILSLLLEKIYDLFYSLWSRIFYFCRPLYILLIKYCNVVDSLLETTNIPNPDQDVPGIGIFFSSIYLNFKYSIGSILT